MPRGDAFRGPQAGHGHRHGLLLRHGGTAGRGDPAGAEVAEEAGPLPGRGAGRVYRPVRGPGSALRRGGHRPGHAPGVHRGHAPGARRGLHHQLRLHVGPLPGRPARDAGGPGLRRPGGGPLLLRGGGGPVPPGLLRQIRPGRPGDRQ